MKLIPHINEVMKNAADTGVQPQCVPERIRRRAYELFEARGRQSGHELDDWLQAEREVKHDLRVELVALK